MPRSVVYFCDGCGTQKGEANHWYVVHAGQPLIIDELRRAENQKHEKYFCGDKCVMEFVSSQIAKLHTTGA